MAEMRKAIVKVLTKFVKGFCRSFRVEPWSRENQHVKVEQAFPAMTHTRGGKQRGKGLIRKAAWRETKA